MRREHLQSRCALLRSRKSSASSPVLPSTSSAHESSGSSIRMRWSSNRTRNSIPRGAIAAACWWCSNGIASSRFLVPRWRLRRSTSSASPGRCSGYRPHRTCRGRRPSRDARLTGLESARQFSPPPSGRPTASSSPRQPRLRPLRLRQPRPRLPDAGYLFKWLAAALGAAVAAYGAYVGPTWIRYGQPPSPTADEIHPLLEQFMPSTTSPHVNNIDVAAPANVTFAAGCEADLMQSRGVRGPRLTRSRLKRSGGRVKSAAVCPKNELRRHADTKGSHR